MLSPFWSLLITIFNIDLPQPQVHKPENSICTWVAVGYPRSFIPMPADLGPVAADLSAAEWP
jgi:hypothetical protein